MTKSAKELGLEIFAMVFQRPLTKVRAGSQGKNTRPGCPAGFSRSPRIRNGWRCSARFSGGVALMSLQAEGGHEACPQSVSTKRVNNGVHQRNTMGPQSVRIGFTTCVHIFFVSAQWVHEVSLPLCAPTQQRVSPKCVRQLCPQSVSTYWLFPRSVSTKCVHNCVRPHHSVYPLSVLPNYVKKVSP